MNDRSTLALNACGSFVNRALAFSLLVLISACQLSVADAEGREWSSQSSFLTKEEQIAVEQWERLQEVPVQCEDAGDISARRACMDQRLFAPLIEKQKARYKVDIRPAIISGVKVEVFTPAEGIAPSNRRRVLINLHGGGFMYGARFEGQIESIPFASVGRIKVISVDYRMAPEHAFPAASEDVVAVYRALLNEYRPGNIGIYGCSAGGVLTAEAVAWIQKEKLPRPGAIGMFCGGASFWTEGDSGAASRAIMADPKRKTQQEKIKQFALAQFHPYFKAANLNDPLVFPVVSKETLAMFPPSLLLSASRDIALSSVVHTHSVLTRLGVKAELHVWEGLGHWFFADPDIPQSQEVYEVTAKFFENNLGAGAGE